MAAKKKRETFRKRRQSEHAASGDQYSVRRLPDSDEFELAPPRSVVRREADLEEVRAMLDAGEVDVAVDELRWLLEGCRPLLEVHKLLGEIAAADNDPQLARAHFGYAYELGLKAIPASGLAGPLPYDRPANRAFFEAGQGLARCLNRDGDRALAAEVIDRLVRLDPSDPLGIGDLLDQSER